MFLSAEVTNLAKIYTRKEVKRRRMNYQIFAGIYDFISIVIGIVVVIACLILLSSLISWVIGDAQVSFASLWDIFTSALIIPE